jgi:hypothetical protein
MVGRGATGLGKAVHGEVRPVMVGHGATGSGQARRH